MPIGPNGPVELEPGTYDFDDLKTRLREALDGDEAGRVVRVRGALRAAKFFASNIPVLRILSLSAAAQTLKVGQASTISIADAITGVVLTGAPPPGMTLNSAGRVLTGTPTVAGSFSLRLTQTLQGAVGSPMEQIFDLPIASDVVTPQPVTLGTITLSATPQAGVANSGTLLGATSGSSITETVTGFAVDSAARTWTWDGSGVAGTIANAIIETHPNATNSGRASPLTIAEATVSFTMTQLAAPNRTFQRATTTGGGQGRGTGTVPVLVNVTTPGPMFARVRLASDGSILKPAFAIASTTAAGTQTVNVPGVDAMEGWFLVDLASSASGPWQAGTVRVGMGRGIAMAGQSQQAFNVVKNTADPASIASTGASISPNASILYRTEDATAPTWGLSDDAGYYNGAYAAELLRRQVASSGVNCFIVGYAQGSTAIAVWQPGQTQNSRLLSIIDAAGGFEVFHWYQGGDDAGAGTAAATYKTGLSGVFNSVMARTNAFTGTVTKIVTAMATRLSGGAGSIANVTAIRRAAKEWAAANGALYSEPHTNVLIDNVHQSQAGGVTHAQITHRDLTTGSAGPALGTITRNKKRITAQMVMQPNSTPLMGSGNPLSRFAAFLTGTIVNPLAMTSITVDSDTSKLLFDLAADPGDAAVLDFYALLHPDPSASLAAIDMIYDSRVDGDGITRGRALQPSLYPIVIPASVATGPVATGKSAIVSPRGVADGAAPAGYNTRYADNIQVLQALNNPDGTANGFSAIGGPGAILSAGTGQQTGNNSGVYPDGVIALYWYANGTFFEEIRGLNNDYVYDIINFASRSAASAGTNRSTKYTLNGVEKTLNAVQNTANTVTFEKISPTNGVIRFSYGPGTIGTDVSPNAYFGPYKIVEYAPGAAASNQLTAGGVPLTANGQPLTAGVY